MNFDLLMIKLVLTNFLRHHTNPTEIYQGKAAITMRAITFPAVTFPAP